jgi:hypothetical protein
MSLLSSLHIINVGTKEVGFEVFEPGQERGEIGCPNAINFFNLL